MEPKIMFNFSRNIIIFFSIILILAIPSDISLYNEITSNSSQPLMVYTGRTYESNHMSFYSIFQTNLESLEQINLQETNMYFSHIDMVNETIVEIFYLENLLWNKIDGNQSSGYYYTQLQELEINPNNVYLKAERRSINDLTKLDFIPDSVISLRSGHIDSELLFILPLSKMPSDSIQTYYEDNVIIENYWEITIRIYKDKKFYNEVGSTDELIDFQVSLANAFTLLMREDKVVGQEFNYIIYNQILIEKQIWKISFDNLIVFIVPFLLLIQLAIIFLNKLQIEAQKESFYLQFIRGSSGSDIFVDLLKTYSIRPLVIQSSIIGLYYFILDEIVFQIVMTLYVPWMIFQFLGISTLIYSYYLRNLLKFRNPYSNVSDQNYHLKELLRISFAVTIIYFIVNLVTYIINYDIRLSNPRILPQFIPPLFAIISFFILLKLSEIVSNESNFKSLSSIILGRNLNRLKVLFILILISNLYVSYNVASFSIDTEVGSKDNEFSITKSFTVDIDVERINRTLLQSNFMNLSKIHGMKSYNINYFSFITISNIDIILNAEISVFDFSTYNSMRKNDFNQLQSELLYVDKSIYYSLDVPVVITFPDNTILPIDPSDMELSDVRTEIGRDVAEIYMDINSDLISYDFLLNNTMRISLDLDLEDGITTLDLEEKISVALEIPNITISIVQNNELSNKFNILIVAISLFYGVFFAWILIWSFFRELQNTLSLLILKYNSKSLIDQIKSDYSKLAILLPTIFQILGFLLSFTSKSLFLSNFNYNDDYNFLKMVYPILILVISQTTFILLTFKIKKT
ncbi:MAG: hypothetical protein INQ03_25605 [Candidatus Heimdallarchaeota archaeon]|nr:hypothetical protein [Candidatus Heimdallarchaeota archaeon]